MKEQWVLCPLCKRKTRLKLQEDTVLRNFLLFCPKCKEEMLIHAKDFQITILKKPDAKTQS